MAVVIVGGLFTSTLLNHFVPPSLYLRFGGRRERAGVALASPGTMPAPSPDPSR